MNCYLAQCALLCIETCCCPQFSEQTSFVKLRLVSVNLDCDIIKTIMSFSGFQGFQLEILEDESKEQKPSDRDFLPKESD